MQNCTTEGQYKRMDDNKSTAVNYSSFGLVLASFLRPPDKLGVNLECRAGRKDKAKKEKGKKCCMLCYLLPSVEYSKCCIVGQYAHHSVCTVRVYVYSYEVGTRAV